jgi:hypothetical protein
LHSPDQLRPNSPPRSHVALPVEGLQVLLVDVPGDGADLDKRLREFGREVGCVKIGGASTTYRAQDTAAPIEGDERDTRETHHPDFRRRKHRHPRLDGARDGAHLCCLCCCLSTGQCSQLRRLYVWACGARGRCSCFAGGSECSDAAVCACAAPLRPHCALSLDLQQLRLRSDHRFMMLPYIHNCCPAGRSASQRGWSSISDHGCICPAERYRNGVRTTNRLCRGVGSLSTGGLVT